VELQVQEIPKVHCVNHVQPLTFKFAMQSAVPVCLTPQWRRRHGHATHLSPSKDSIQMQWAQCTAGEYRDYL